MGSKNFQYLDELIHSSANEIVLDSDIVLDFDEESEYDDGIKLDVDDLTIDGNGHVIDAKDGLCSLKNHGKNITFKNLCFKNFKSKFPISNQSGDLIFENCRFIHNQGTIYNYFGNIWLKNCCFYRNYLSRSSSGYSVCIYNAKDSKAFVSDSHFYQNEVNYPHYGLILNDGLIEVKNSIFHENKGEDCEICVIFNRKGELLVDNCKFKDNKNVYCSYDFAELIVSILNEAGKVSLSNSTFENENRILGSIKNMGICRIIDCKFKDSLIYNSQWYSSVSRPDELDFSPYLEIEDSSFANKYDEGVIANSGLCKIASCNIDGRSYLNNDDVLFIDEKDFNLLKDNIINSGEIVFDYEGDVPIYESFKSHGKSNGTNSNLEDDLDNDKRDGDYLPLGALFR